MKTFEECIQEEFKKLVPYTPLTAPELAAIIQGTKAWLEEHREATMESLHKNTTPDSSGSWLLIPCITFIDRTLIASLGNKAITEGQ